MALTLPSELLDGAACLEGHVDRNGVEVLVDAGLVLVPIADVTGAARLLRTAADVLTVAHDQAAR